MNKLGCLTETEQKAVERFSVLVKKKLGSELILIKLFGSKIRGDFNKDSDIDILIVVKKDRLTNKKKIFDVLENIDPYFELKISPVIFTEYEYTKNKEMQSTFTEAVEKEGVSL
jgi:predicted nucleotidyltransferase